MSSRPKRGGRRIARRGTIPTGTRELVHGILEFLAARVGRERPWAHVLELRQKLRHAEPDDLREALAKLTKRGVLAERTTSARKEWALAAVVPPPPPDVSARVDVAPPSGWAKDALEG